MEPDADHGLRSKEDVKIFVAEKSVREKKPFTVVKSEHRRFVAICPNDNCQFRLCFFQRIDGCFHVSEERPHTCKDVFPTIRRVWVVSKVREILLGAPTITASQIVDRLRESFGVDVDKMMLNRAIHEVKNNSPDRVILLGESVLSRKLFPRPREGP